MLNRNCAACGGVLQRASNNTAVCMKCFRTYKIGDTQIAPNPAFQRQNEGSLSADARVGLILIFSILGLIFLAAGAFPLTVIMVMMCAWAAKTKARTPQEEPVRSVACGEYLKNRKDYLRALRDLPLGTMPLGIYGERAAEQIERLTVKQQGLKAMLGSDHPFVRSANEAEGYVLENCKKILWRLKYCDQTDAGLCRLHAEYLQGVLEANEKVLRDYEKLLIEVTQMDEGTPAAVPALDVLADSLHSVRTGETGAALPQQKMTMMRF